LADFAKVKIPTLGIVGTADPFLKDFTALQSAMPQIKLVTIPDANHSSAPGRPEFVQALQSFLASHNATQ
jgi:pimeloyl-ACP methyl ester carboxylesterase